MNFDFRAEYFTHVLTVNGKLVEVPLRRGISDAAFIDYLTFTVSKTTFDEMLNQEVVWHTQPDDEVYIYYISQILYEIFGFGITEKRNGRGKFFYESYYQLGPVEVNYGTVHIGGQRNTVLVDLNGVGCQAAKPNWEQRLYDFAQTADRFSISRVDVAHDFFNGEYSPIDAKNDYDMGKFRVKGMLPKYKLEGLDWFNNDLSGKTLYIGRRGSSKFCRIYEKGKQLGDKNSLWSRFEIEFRKNDTLILPDVLINSGQYLTGAYPVGQELFTNVAKRMDSSKRKLDTVLDEKIYYGRNQVGKLIRYLFDIGWNYEQIVKALIGIEGHYPSGLKPLEYDCKAVKVKYQHEQTLESTGLIKSQEEYVNDMRNVITLLRQSEKNLILEKFDEDVEFWQFHKRIGSGKAEMLFDELFNKYSSYYWL